jgi:hypothetical protein
VLGNNSFEVMFGRQPEESFAVAVDVVAAQNRLSSRETYMFPDESVQLEYSLKQGLHRLSGCFSGGRVVSHVCVTFDT